MSNPQCRYCGLSEGWCPDFGCLSIEQVNGLAGYGWYWWEADNRRAGVWGKFANRTAALTHALEYARG